MGNGVGQSTAEKIAFLGLGNLGRAIVRRLREVYPETIFYVWTRDTSKKELFASEVGAVAIRNLEDVQNKEIKLVFLCLFGSDEVEEILKRIVDGGERKIFVDLTTNHPMRTPTFAKMVEEGGGTYIEAPVLGSVVPASQGKLTMLVAGRKSVYENIKELLSSIARKIFYLGEEIGSASKMKLVNNLVLGSFMNAIAEAIAIGEMLGFEKELIIDVLKNGAGNSAVLSAKEEKLKKEDFSPHFSVSLIKKDLDYLADVLQSIVDGGGEFSSGDEMRLPFSCVKDAFGSAKLHGLSQLDFSAIYVLYRDKLNEMRKEK